MDKTNFTHLQSDTQGAVNEIVDSDCSGAVGRLRTTAFDGHAAAAGRQLLLRAGFRQLSGVRHQLSSKGPGLLQNGEQHDIEYRGLVHSRSIVHMPMRSEARASVTSDRFAA
jgi:hypothetical protein